ncbi:hypothetical protein D3C87_1231200 [compost metagenome]
MTQTKPMRLLKTRAVSCSPVTGWASYPRMIAVCRARGHARTAGLLTDISSFLVVRRRNGRRGPIEYSRARHAPDTRLQAGFAARGGPLRCRLNAACRGIPATEFISVRPKLCRAPMNRSLDWSHAVSRFGSVGSPS